MAIPVYDSVQSLQFGGALYGTANSTTQPRP